MIHFICTGACKGKSAEPGECKDNTCNNFGFELEECDCEDGEHYGRHADVPEEDMPMIPHEEN